MPVASILVAAPSGFCAGVEAALKALAWMLVLHEPPIYCVHAIVHNEDVVARFEALGVVFVDAPADVPCGRPMMLSAHGSAPAAVAAAHARTSVVVDAVCPLVAKVHHEVRARAGEGYTVLYVGHAGHDEAVGALAQAPSATVLVGDAAAVAVLPSPQSPVAVLAQTTLSVGQWDDVVTAARDRFGSVWVPPRDDICFATTNRQAAVRAIAQRAATVVVVGSATSANTAALVTTARDAGCGRVLRVLGAAELPGDLDGVVGVAAGASTPPGAVAAVLQALGPATVEAVSVVDELEYFPLPPPLRRAVGAIVARQGLPQDLARAFVDDRAVSAEHLLGLVSTYRSRHSCAASST